MENSNGKGKSNVAVIVLLSIVIVLLLVVIGILVAKNGGLVLFSEKKSDVADYSANNSGANNAGANNAGDMTNSSDDGEVALPSDDANTISETSNIKLNNKEYKVKVDCATSVDESNEDFTTYNTNYSITVDGKTWSGIPQLWSILSDNPKAEDCFAVSKISDETSDNEYLLLQLYSHWINGTTINMYILDNELNVYGVIVHTAGTTFDVNGKTQELKINSDNISDFVWCKEGVAHHVYSISGGRFTDTIQKVYKEGEYEAAGRT